MKKSILYILVIAILGALAWYFVTENKNQSSIEDMEAQYDFAVKDTAAITKIILEDKAPNKTVLTREGKKWMVNGEYEARPDAVEVLLETLNKQTMRGFVPVKTQENIINRLAVYGKEVRIYEGEKLIKHFFVGTETRDQTGTYMMLKNADEPFSVHIQGFVGYLNSRYFTDPVLWRRRLLFSYSKNEIATIKMEYPAKPEAGFIIDNNGEKPVLKTLNGEIVEGALEVNLNITLGSFKTASYEGGIVPTDGIYMKRDSLMAAEPKLIYTVTTKDGKTHQMKALLKNADPQHRTEEGGNHTFDPDRMYAFMDDGRWVLIQNYGLRNMLVEKDFYMTELLFLD